MGHRFTNLSNMWSMVTKQFVLSPDTGLKPFQYVFTKFDEKHRTRLCQQFAHVKEDLQAYNNSENQYGNNPLQNKYNKLIYIRLPNYQF